MEEQEAPVFEPVSGAPVGDGVGNGAEGIAGVGQRGGAGGGWQCWGSSGAHARLYLEQRWEDWENLTLPPRLLPELKPPPLIAPRAPEPEPKPLPPPQPLPPPNPNPLPPLNPLPPAGPKPPLKLPP